MSINSLISLFFFAHVFLTKTVALYCPFSSGFPTNVTAPLSTVVALKVKLGYVSLMMFWNIQTDFLNKMYLKVASRGTIYIPQVSCLKWWTFFNINGFTINIYNVIKVIFVVPRYNSYFQCYLWEKKILVWVVSWAVSKSF